MTNDDKDLNLKKLNAINKLREFVSNLERLPSALNKIIDDNFWELLEATPQQPSEPLKELDEKAILIVLDQCCPVSMDKMAKEMIAQILWNKFGQPTEKKALSVEEIDKIIGTWKSCDFNDDGNQCDLCGICKKGRLSLATAIFDALPARKEGV